MASQSLTLFAKQKGLTLLPDNAQWTNRVQVKSESSSRLYTIALNKSSGQWGCSCMGWIRHRRCKHLDTFVPAFKALSK